MVYLIKYNLDMYIYCITQPGKETKFYFKKYDLNDDGMPIFDLKYYHDFKDGYENRECKTHYIDEYEIICMVEDVIYLLDMKKHTSVQVACNTQNMLFVGNGVVIKFFDDDKLYYFDKTTMQNEPVCSMYDGADTQDKLYIVDHMGGYNGDVYMLFSDNLKYYAAKINVYNKTAEKIYCIDTPRKYDKTERIFFLIDKINVVLDNKEYVIILNNNI